MDQLVNAVMAVNETGENRTFAAFRAAVLAVYVFGTTGTVVELFLLGHVEDVWQQLPIALLLITLPLVAWTLIWPSRPAVLTFRTVMTVLVVVGVVGVVLHYQGNTEFEREMYPAIAGLELFREAMTGATPALAPGQMSQLGLFGLIYTMRHPALRRSGAQ